MIFTIPEQTFTIDEGGYVRIKVIVTGDTPTSVVEAPVIPQVEPAPVEVPVVTPEPVVEAPIEAEPVVVEEDKATE